MKKQITKFDEFEMTLPALGEHTGRVLSYKLVTEAEAGAGKQPYYAVTIEANDCAIQTRIYGGRVAYFMGAIARQTDGAIAGLKFTQVLEYLTKHDFSVWATWDEKYGMQYNFTEPKS